jgi:uncharacterized protein (DUF1015 family)
VTRFEPFPALRYSKPDLDDVVAPPYDVLSDAEVDELAARSPHNIVHVDVPREQDGPDRYQQAAATLRQWIADEVMVYDESPTFTLYRMRFRDETGAERDIVGVMGGLEVVDEGAGGVLPHERTTPKASTDRLDLTRATSANLSPVWGLSLADGLTELLRQPGEAIGEVIVDDVEHRVERLSDPDRLDAIAAAVARDDVLIADGHHRYGVSRIYRDEVRQATGRNDTDAELTLAFVSELVDDQLSVDAIHRLYTDVDETDLIAALDGHFEREAAGPPDAGTLAAMEREGRLFLLLGDGSGYWLTPKPGAFEGLRALDGAWLERALSAVPHNVTYQHGVDQAVEAVADGQASLAVLIRPVAVVEITRTAREGLLMPPKSTFFTPKLRTGFVVRSAG